MTIDISTLRFFLRATYKDDQPLASINVHNFTLYRFTLYRDSKFPGIYNASCVFYRDHSYIAENELRRVLSDFTAGRIILEVVPYGDKDETHSHYQVLTAPDIDITPTEITLTCTCVQVLPKNPCAPYTFNKPETTNVSLPGSYIPNIIEVIFNNPATIVYWSDGTKTVVKACDKDTFDKETGLAMAIAKKTLSYKCLQPRALFKHIVKSAKDYSDNQ